MLTHLSIKSNHAVFDSNDDTSKTQTNAVYICLYTIQHVELKVDWACILNKLAITKMATN